ncbi:tRNA (adenosine(37)-N6)-threonylcarbamoyltransferase complex dimerization subunit type 1 TsaB [Planifilum fimeticola]
MKILAIDTSTLVMGVSLLDDDRVLGEVTTNLRKDHSVRLMPTVARLLEELRLSLSDLDLIAVASGPGSYTGVRIGVTTAKTMAWSRNLPLIGISSLAVLAMNGLRFDGKIAPLFDARRDRVYTGLFQGSEAGEMRSVKKERVTPIDEWLEELKEEGPVLFLGDDVGHFRERIERALGENASFGFPPENIPRASCLGRLALARWRREEQGEGTDFTPNYLQLAEAEAKWLSRRGNGKST